LATDEPESPTREPDGKESVFEPVPAKFIEQCRARCATESIREPRRHPPVIRYKWWRCFAGAGVSN
jgi:hypothetical protein